MDAPWTAVNDTPNKSIRQNVARRGVCLHHAALKDLDYLRRLEMGEKQVSSSAICKDHDLERMMPDDTWRPWSLSSAFWDSTLRSIETCNDAIEGWTVSDESIWSDAMAIAYWATIDGFWPHRDGPRSTWTVYGHREIYEEYGDSYATACPGGLDLDLATSRAQDILQGGTPTPPPINRRTEDMSVIYIATSASADGVIPKGYSFIQDADGPLRPLSTNAYSAYVFWADAARGEERVNTRWLRWAGDDIRNETKVCGLRQWDGLLPGNIPKLTGRIIYDNPATADYPKVSGVTAPAIDYAELAKEVAKLVPTADQNGAAARAAIVK